MRCARVSPRRGTDLLHHLDRLLAEYGYGLTGVVVALEAMGLPLPGESMIVAAAVYCATTHKLSIWWMLVAAIAGAIMGDNAGYLIGRWIGFRMLARYGRKVGLSEDRITLGRYLFRRYGAVVVFTGRFVAILRTFVALLAGANRMPWDRFLLWNALGGTAWVMAYGLGAFWAGKAIEHVAGPVGIAIGIVAAIAVAGVFVFLKRNERRLTDEAMRAARSDNRNRG